jgi:hypothetical protein
MQTRWLGSAGKEERDNRFCAIERNQIFFCAIEKIIFSYISSFEFFFSCVSLSNRKHILKKILKKSLL